TTATGLASGQPKRNGALTPRFERDELHNPRRRTGLHGGRVVTADRSHESILHDVSVGRGNDATGKVGTGSRKEAVGRASRGDEFIGCCGCDGTAVCGCAGTGRGFADVERIYLV